MNLSRSFAFALTVLLTQQIQAQTMPAPETVRLDELKLMEGFPPPADKQVTAQNFLMQFPNLRWAFHHMRELLPSRNIRRGASAPSVLSVGEDLRARIDALNFVGPEGNDLTFGQYLEATYADATLIMKDGKVIYEAYHEGMPAENPHMLWSVTKSFAGLIATQLLEEGILKADALITDYVPELKGSGWSGATIQQLLNMTADIDYSEVYADQESDVVKYAMSAGMLPTPEDFAGERDLYSYLPTIPADGQHGERFIYRTVHTEVLGWVLRRATGKHLADLISERIWSKLGAEQDAYLLLDSKGTEWAGAGLNATLRDLGRFAEMLRLNGRFNGQQIIDSSVIASIREGADREAFKASGRDYQPGYSYRNKWWISHNADGAYEALGVHGQMIHVNPAVGLVVVRLSSHPVATSAVTFPITRPALAALADMLR
ncbi:serine hydrolase domain-containing protein [Halopseudomonas salina]|uniref:6-aminohexanoate-dimer hydrolase n=1 Tax=Halopseudomonas salina TaxID=1323744 RepID=A0ABQ1P289_9GAMM|nr:serine hydrolase [Halopseudomonas salina]GGC87964.1 6-aminohexanoate-dimer hydrolase [Halopseudomonas salina]